MEMKPYRDAAEMEKEPEDMTDKEYTRELILMAEALELEGGGNTDGLK